MVHARGGSSASTQCVSRILENLAGASNQMPIDNIKALLRLPKSRAKREFPFNQDLELIMDIMKYGSDVEVLEPIDLREKIINLLQDNLNLYQVRN